MLFRRHSVALRDAIGKETIWRNAEASLFLYKKAKLLYNLLTVLCIVCNDYLTCTSNYKLFCVVCFFLSSWAEHTRSSLKCMEVFEGCSKIVHLQSLKSPARFLKGGGSKRFLDIPVVEIP